jgi:predicted alpha/beta hydrolase family esterase
MNEFRSTVLILPGLGNSGDGHWQTLWEKQFGFIRVNQADWEKPVCADWVKSIESAVSACDSRSVILVGHSLACSTIGYWSQATQKRIRGALLVAPSDTEAPSYPPGTKGFDPMPMTELPFPSITVASTNDFYVTADRARTFASAWGSELFFIGAAGHINVSAGFGEWRDGLNYVLKLDQLQ